MVASFAEGSLEPVDSLGDDEGYGSTVTVKGADEGSRTRLGM
jgi:hypothetical protein